MIEPSPAPRFPDEPRADADLLAGFAPRCGTCLGLLQLRHSGSHAWWECDDCALPRIG